VGLILLDPTVIVGFLDADDALHEVFSAPAATGRRSRDSAAR
jgi:hypothetical protein